MATKLVALLAEGVDRNVFTPMLNPPELKSPSSRRAWIEIRTGRIRSQSRAVALLAEGVDRNINEAVNRYLVELGRPPRGGRG